MKLEIELPESRVPRTHIAAKVAADYVSHALSKLDASAWTELMNNGSISGKVEAEYVGLVSWTVYSD